MKWLEKLTGLDKIRKEAEEKIAKADEKTMSEKERATRKKEPWVGVIETHVNKENVRNGFFELDWNKYFIEQLRDQGYGLEGDPDEEVVDRWFRELCANVVVDGDYGGTVDTGMLNVDAVKRDNR
jgi:hypothetical protein